MKITEIAALPTVLDLKKYFLMDAPEDELFTLRELWLKFGIPESTIKNSKELGPYKTKHGGKNYCGSPAAIASFERQTKL